MHKWLATISEDSEKEIEADIIEKNYDHFVNVENIQVRSEANEGTALAFGIRDGNYYSIDEAANERTPITKKYVGTMSEDKTNVETYGIVNEGLIGVQSFGSETKAFGIMSGYYDGDNNSNEEFVISTVKNNGNILVHSENK